MWRLTRVADEGGRGGGWLSSLADRIEAYIIRLLEHSGEGYVEMRRFEVADRFACVPSQVTYVLSTRFTPDRGFYVESRRGGGGYIRIVARHPQPVPDGLETLWERLGPTLTEAETDALLRSLERVGLLTKREKTMARQVVRSETEPLDPRLRGVMRAGLVKGMLLLLSADEDRDIR